MITAEAFIAVEASLTKLVQKEAATVTKAVYAKVSEALSAKDYQKAREALSELNLGGMFAKNEKALTYMTNVAMLFGASRVTQQPGTSVVGMGFEKLATQQLVATFLQMVRQKAEAYLIKAGTDHIDELESKSLESVQKYNDKHDKLGRFARADGVGGGSPLGAGIKAGNSAYAKNAGIAYPKAEGVEVPPLGKGEIYLVRYSKEDETDTVEGVGHFAYAGKHIDDVVNSTAAYAQDTSKGYLLIGRTEDREWKHTADEESSGQEYNGVLGTKYGAVDMVIDLSTGGVKHLTKKANPYHDEKGRFTTKEKSASGTSEAYKIYAKAVSSVSGWEKGSDYNGEVRLVPLSKIDTQPDEVWSEEYRRGSGQKTIDYLKKEAFGTVYEGGRTVGSNKLEALLVRSTDSGRYQLVDGQHRYNLLKQIGSSVAGVQVIGAVQKSNPYHDAEGKFTTKDKDADHYSALREFTKAEIALLKGVKISTGSKLAEAMDNATEGHVDVQAIKATLAKGGKNYAQVEIPLSHLDWGSVTDEVAAVRADPNKGAILVGANGEIVDGRHRSLLAKQSGDKTIRAWVPVADALNILSKVQKAERILRPYELEPKSLESVQKANPYHDELGRFTEKANDVWFHGTAVGGGGVPEGELQLKPGLDGALWLTKDMSKAVRYAANAANSKGGEAYVFVVDAKDAPQDDSNFGDDMVRATIFSPKAIGLISVGGVKKAERILKPFESFVDEAGKAYFNMVSSLHTSRVSAYGFTAEANVLGVEEYQINEQLDARTCPVCEAMHGKTFKVSDARRLLEIVTRVSDPDDLKALQPWPKQNKDNLEKIKEMTSEELVAQGWHIPPFHPGCRGLLGRVGKVPSLSNVKAGAVAEKYAAQKEDFKTFKLSASDKQVALWNATVGLPPAEVFARLTGRTADELLAAVVGAKDPKAEAGLYSVSIAKNITVRMTKEGFGSKNPFDQGVVFKTESKEVYIDSVELSGEDQAGGVVKKYMREIYTLAKDAGATKLGLTAGLEVGGYAWAKYGFKPTIKAWETLKKDLYAKSAKLGYQTLLPEEKSKLLNALLSSDDPASIFTLSDTIGKDLLMGSMWEGALDFADAESITRFLSYIGELK